MKLIKEKEMKDIIIDFDNQNENEINMQIQEYQEVQQMRRRIYFIAEKKVLPENYKDNLQFSNNEENDKENLMENNDDDLKFNNDEESNMDRIQFKEDGEMIDILREHKKEENNFLEIQMKMVNYMYKR